jgi:hypothetical protein
VLWANPVEVVGVPRVAPIPAIVLNPTTVESSLMISQWNLAFSKWLKDTEILEKLEAWCGRVQMRQESPNTALMSPTETRASPCAISESLRGSWNGKASRSSLILIKYFALNSSSQIQYTIIY